MRHSAKFALSALRLSGCCLIQSLFCSGVLKRLKSLSKFFLFFWTCSHCRSSTFCWPMLNLQLAAFLLAVNGPIVGVQGESF